MKIIIEQGDITAKRVDAIVNAANSRLVGGGGVDGAIHRCAGPELDAACREIGGCPRGEVRLTPGFRLPAKYIIHTVGPVWQGGGMGEARVLANCYLNSLLLAEEKGFQSIAFPAISAGIYGYPLEKAAAVAIESCMAFGERTLNVKEVYLVCFSEIDKRIYNATWKMINKVEDFPMDFIEDDE